MIFRLCILFLILAGCEEESSQCKYNGQIVGYDGTECLCCPGWLIKVNDDSIKIQNLPDENTLWEKARKEGYPISISLEYEDIVEQSCNNYKKLICFELN